MMWLESKVINLGLDSLKEVSRSFSTSLSVKGGVSVIKLGAMLNASFITYSGHIQLCYEDIEGKHKILCKLSDLKYDGRFAKFRLYYVSNINLDTFTITLVKEDPNS